MSIKIKLILSFITMLVVPVTLFVIVLNFSIPVFLNAFAIPINSTSFSMGLTFHNSTNPTMRKTLLQNMLLHPNQLENISFLATVERELQQGPVKTGLIIRRQNRIIYSSPVITKFINTKQLPQFGSFSDQNQIRIANSIYNYSQYDFYFKNNIPGSVFILSDQTPANAIFRKIAMILAGAFILILFLTNGLLTFFISRSISKPLNLLKKASEQIKDGDLNFQISYSPQNELGQLAAAFEEMRVRLRDSLEKQNQYETNRKELISGISHDLKTPITAIKGYVEGIIDGIADTPEKMKHYLQTIHTKANHMDRLIDELFLLSKLDLKKIPSRFEPVAIRTYLEDCIGELRYDLAAKNIGLVFFTGCHKEITVTADREKLKRVMTNIIDNAVKYMDEQKEALCITIRLNEFTDTIRIEINDNGQGIPEEDLPFIFDRFYRTDPARNSSIGGSGLGLAIAKLIIEEHGGEIWAESRFGEGTSIFFNLRKSMNTGECFHETNFNY